VKKRLADNKLSLNLEQRKAEIDEEKARKEARKAERAKAKPPEEKRYVVTLENVANPELQPYEEKKKEKDKDKVEVPKDDDADDDDAVDTEGAGKTVDAIRNETLNILTDLVELGRGAKTAQAAPAK